MTTNLKTTAEVQTLIKAKKLLVEKGWIKRVFESTDGYCLVGAIREAEWLTRPARSVSDLDLRSLVCRAIFGRSAGRYWLDVYVFNDTHTKEEVLAVLDKAIALGLGVT